MEEHTNFEQEEPSNETNYSDSVSQEEKLKQYREKLRLEQNLPMGIAAGIGASLIGAVLWAVITVSTGYQIGYMAIGVGFLVGYTMGFVGKGMDQIFGIIGGALALIGCLLGNMLSVIGFAASELQIGFFEVLGNLEFSLLWQAFIATFSPIDLVFYGIAIYEGYHFSFRKISEEELANNTQG